MKLIKCDATLMDISELPEHVRQIASAARVSHDSAAKEDEEQFVRSLLNRGHTVPLEFMHATFRFVGSRAAMDEFRTYRIGFSHVMRSTRYVNEAKGDMQFVLPVAASDATAPAYCQAFEEAERRYRELLAAGSPPQFARAVLPLNVASQMETCGSFLAWRHLLSQRLTNGAHPEVREIAQRVLSKLVGRCPVVFDDLQRLQ